MSPPARSMSHSTTKVPACVLIVWPSLPGHTTDDVATGAVEVAVDEVAEEALAEDAPADVDVPEVAAPEVETRAVGVVVI